MKITVVRSKWARGNGDGKGSLLDVDGCRCCFGFVAQQCGVEDSNAIGVNRLDELKLFFESVRQFQHKGYGKEYVDHDWVNSAYAINDFDGINDEEREKQLIELFKENGHEIEFVD